MVISKTPFRISFFGGGTDYPAWFKEHGGQVLSTTIDKYCYLSVRHFPPFFHYKHRIVYSKIETVSDWNEIEHPAVKGILQFLGIEKGLSIHHDGDLPARTGLGSSSAFTVGLLHALHTLQNQHLSKEELAKEAVHIEQDLLKENVGSQDQVATAYGGFNAITFFRNGEFIVEPIQLSSELEKELENSLRLYFSGFERTASEVAKAQIDNMPRREKELEEMQEIVAAGIRILQRNKVREAVEEFGRLLHQTWEIKKSLSNRITTPEIDAMYEKAKKAGALGGKLLGAGGGGFLLLCIPQDRQESVREALQGYLEVRFRFEKEGSRILYKNHKV